MELLIQRVTEASVSVEGQIIGKIGRGLLVLVGIGSVDLECEKQRQLEIADKMVKKLVGA